MISFSLTEEEKELRNVAHDFAKERIRPIVREAEKTGTPDSLKKEAFEIGFGRMGFPEELEGSSLSLFNQMLIQEELLLD